DVRGLEAPQHGPRASQKGARNMSKVRLAIVGAGNCASSLVQGLEYYKDADPSDTVPGLMHVDLGGYHIRDVELAAGLSRGTQRGPGPPSGRRSSPSPTTRSASRRSRRPA